MLHIESNLPAEAHTPMYNWHKYWGRKTWNVVGQFIERYCPEGGTVLDPFSGSGVIAIEALRRGRRAIAIDISPMANNILMATVDPLNLLHLLDAYKRIKSAVQDNIEQLYATRCRSCGKQVIFSNMIWDGKKPAEVRYKCPHCGDRKEFGCSLLAIDFDLIANINNAEIKLPYPKNPFYYPDGKPFKEKQKYESVDSVFTKRNLLALAILRNEIEQEPDQQLRFMLKMAFTSMVHLCSCMTPVRPTRPFSSLWSEHSYWYAKKFMEQNVWNEFESTVIGRQGLVEAKKESNEVLKGIKVAKNLKQFLNKSGDLLVHTGDSLEMMNQIPDGLIDYIFTDPPYDSSIQYGELSYLWTAWFGAEENYLENLTNEVIHNERQNKDFEAYYRMLSTAFSGMYNKLGHENYLTLTFHNPATKVRNATIRAGIFAGFDFEKIHWQELARPSAKSLLQPFGSANGDFYLRFHKPAKGMAASSPTEIDEARFEKIVLETTKQVLAERGEPTPYTIIINYIDPILAKHGYFLALHTGLDVKTVLQNHLGIEFVLVPGKIGDAAGQLWWFKDTSIIPHFEIPLSERVEQTIIRKLMGRPKVNFTQVWEAVSIEFPNSLTSDSVSIMDILKEYAKKEAGGYWRLKPVVVQRQTQHAEIISILAEIGIGKGFDTWVGSKEQTNYTIGVAGSKRLLSDYCKPKILELRSLNKEQFVEVANIDLLWHQNKVIKAVFEIENTTAMTEALRRSSTIPYQVPKYMVLPDERVNQFIKKLKSPLFGQWFEHDQWQVVYYDSLENNASALKQGKKELSEIVNKLSTKLIKKKQDDVKQLGLL